MIRVSDRLETFTVLAVLLLALLAVPVAMHVENLVYVAGMRTADEQAHSRHPVAAVVVEGSTGMPADFDSPVYVQVQWRDGAQLRTERVASPGTVKTGASMDIWLNQEGKVVSAPLTPSDAEVTAVGIAWFVWSAAVFGSTLVAFFIRKRLDRSRAQAWERELQLWAHNDDGWANRHT